MPSAAADDRFRTRGCGDLSEARNRGRRGRQESLFVTAERAVVRLTDDQYAEHLSVVDDRHAKKGVVRPSAELGEMAKARMLLRIGQADRALGFNDQADQPFSSSEAHCSNRAGIQTVGRHKDEAGVRRVHEVYGADIHGQMRFDATNDDRQPVVQTDCVAERPGDAVESVKHRQQPARVQSQQYRFECTNPDCLWNFVTAVYACALMLMKLRAGTAPKAA